MKRKVTSSRRKGRKGEGGTQLYKRERLYKYGQYTLDLSRTGREDICAYERDHIKSLGVGRGGGELENLPGVSVLTPSTWGTCESASRDTRMQRWIRWRERKQGKSMGGRSTGVYVCVHGDTRRKSGRRWMKESEKKERTRRDGTSKGIRRSEGGPESPRQKK
ncbi:hypothetical protein BDZ97DRAFT_1756444 [Flammula alnicola]|nr:hypothetical protein BDZ97DRAFT_1756444 [Flammula alnicola]